jgi:hypothetical protein
MRKARNHNRRHQLICARRHSAARCDPGSQKRRRRHTAASCAPGMEKAASVPVAQNPRRSRLPLPLRHILYVGPMRAALLDKTKDGTIDPLARVRAAP